MARCLAHVREGLSDHDTEERTSSWSAECQFIRHAPASSHASSRQPDAMLSSSRTHHNAAHPNVIAVTSHQSPSACQLVQANPQHVFAGRGIGWHGEREVVREHLAGAPGRRRIGAIKRLAVLLGHDARRIDERLSSTADASIRDASRAGR